MKAVGFLLLYGTVHILCHPYSLILKEPHVPFSVENVDLGKTIFLKEQQIISSLPPAAFKRDPIEIITLELAPKEFNLDRELVNGSSKLKNIPIKSAILSNTSRVVSDFKNLQEPIHMFTVSILSSHIANMRTKLNSSYPSLRKKILSIESSVDRIGEEKFCDTCGTIQFLEIKDVDSKELHSSNNEFGVVTSIKISKTYLNTLKPGIFDDVYKLRVLKLNHNKKLTLIKKNIFAKLDNLWILELHSNNLEKLEEGAFNNLSSLYKMRLDNNKLTLLAKNIFHGLRNLNTLNLSYNQLRNLEAGVFDDLYSLKALSLNNNDLTSIPSYLFKNLNQLPTVELSWNKLNTIENEAFSGIQTSAKIYLDNNNLTILNHGIFNGLKLSELYLQHNRFSEIEPSVLSELGLSYLDLSNNTLTDFDGEAFNKMTAVEYLRLDGVASTVLMFHHYIKQSHDEDYFSGLYTNGCQDIQTAIKCHDIKYCIEKSWKSMEVSADNENVCNVCKQMMEEAREKLDRNQTLGDVKKVFRNSCPLMVDEPIITICNDFVRTFFLPLVEILKFPEINPLIVCSISAFCNPERIDQL